VQRFVFLVRGIGMRATASAGVSDEEIYAGLRDDLIRFARVLVGSTEAPDVVSTVVVRVLSRRHLSDLDDPKPYLYRAVVNEARSLHRKRGRLAHLVPSVVPANPDPVVDSVVLEAVADLPPRQRAATYLVYWEGFTPKEAAQLMMVRPGTVRRYLHLAREHLRRVLDYA
jgi:DNA-directed RNA polymerase specialized sigma24 family protein